MTAALHQTPLLVTPLGLLSAACVGLRLRAEQVWQQAAPTFNSKILGPHFEDLARDFTLRYAHTLLPGGLPGPVGTASIPTWSTWRSAVTISSWSTCPRSTAADTSQLAGGVRT